MLGSGRVPADVLKHTSWLMACFCWYTLLTGLAPELTEGDVITIFSQFGEPVDINLPRDKQTGRTRGFGFLMYEDQKSTILAVDNLNGSKVLNRTLRVDHVSKYKQLEKDDESGKFREADSERMNARLELFMSTPKPPERKPIPY